MYASKINLNNEIMNPAQQNRTSQKNPEGLFAAIFDNSRSMSEMSRKTPSYKTDVSKELADSGLETDLLDELEEDTVSQQTVISWFFSPLPVINNNAETENIPEDMISEETVVSILEGEITENDLSSIAISDNSETEKGSAEFDAAIEKAISETLEVPAENETKAPETQAAHENTVTEKQEIPANREQTVLTEPAEQQPAAMQTVPQNREPEAVTEPAEQQPAAVQAVPQNREPEVVTESASQEPEVVTEPAKQEPIMQAKTASQEPSVVTEPAKQEPTAQNVPANQEPSVKTEQVNQEPAAQAVRETGELPVKAEPASQEPITQAEPVSQEPTVKAEPASREPIAQNAPANQEAQNAADEKTPLAAAQNNIETTESNMARMPQETGLEIDPQTLNNEEIQVGGEIGELVTKNDNEDIGDTADVVDPRPLENENDKAGPETLTAPQDGTQNIAKSASSEKKNETGRETDYKPAAQTPNETQTIIAQPAIDIAPEKVNAAEHLTQAAQQTPVAAENIFDAMVEKIEVMQASEQNQMSIQLKPDFLGKVSIQLTLGDNGLQVKINADDVNVKSMISSQLNQLTESLSDKGIKVNAIEVVYTGVSDMQYGNQSGTRQDMQRESSRGYYAYQPQNEDTSSVASWNQILEMDTEISSVEYRA